jgi:hypothetical protein
MITLQDPEGANRLPDKLPPIRLHRRQMIGLLTELGYGAGVSYETFYEYIKSLRKLGIPFRFGTIKARTRFRSQYSYDDVMELAMTLSLRIYHVVPDVVLTQIVRHRAQLHRFYRRAYAERWTGKGSPIDVRRKDGRPITLHGLFLDLGVSFSGGKLVKFGPPKLLSPEEALRMSVQRMLTVQVLLPLNISVLAERVVTLALTAPASRRGSNEGARRRH